MTRRVMLKNWKWVEKVLPGLLESQNWFPGFFWAHELVPGLYQSRNWFPGLFQVPELVPRPLSSPWYERKQLTLKFGHHTQKTVVHLALETFQWCHLALMSYAEGCHKNTNMPHSNWRQLSVVLENHDEASLTYLCTARFLQWYQCYFRIPL